MTRCLFLAIATLAGAIAALFWAFVKVGGDFRERALQAGLADSDGWREAEAALPEGWFFRLQRLSDRYYIAFSGEAEHPQGFGRVTEPLDTPAAALRALSAKLREAKPLDPPAGLPGVPRRPFR